MPSIASSTVRLLRRLLGVPPRRAGPYQGSATALDGNTAVALVESTLGEAAALGGGFPADTAAIVWRAEQHRLGTNLMGKPLSGQTTEGPRGAMAMAIGLSLSGVRATAFLSSQDLASAQDLLASAAGHRLPLVLHLSQRALASQAAPVGSGHEAYHLSASSGCFLLFAANVQEAVDLTLIARRVSELALVPGLVAMDGDRTALAVQEVRLPPGELIEAYLGSPDDTIPAPTPAQGLLFGVGRRRLPRWHDLDRPVLQGAQGSPESWGLGVAAGRAYLDVHLTPLLEESIALFAQQTGREHRRVSAYRVEDADLVLVAQGATIETAEAVAEQARSTHKLKVGVLGIRCLRPFPGRDVAALLGGKRTVCVLERLDSPLGEDPPLLRDLRTVLGKAAETQVTQGTRFLSALYGLGGMPLRGADLLRLCREAPSMQRSQVYLGMALAPAASPYPKRQALLDRLRRSYPEIQDLGLKDSAPSPDLRPKGALTLAIHRLSGQGGEGLATEAAVFLRQLVGGQIRSLPALPAEPWGSCCIDRITSAPDRLKDPGDEIPLDLSLLLQGVDGPRLSHLDHLQGGALLVEASSPGLPEAVKRGLHSGGITLLVLPPFEDPAQGEPNPTALHTEYQLGALFGALMDQGLLELSARRVMSGREEALRSLGTGVMEGRLDAFKAGMEGVQRLDPEVTQTWEPPGEGVPQAAPQVVRRLGNIDDAFDSLPRFWDQVGVLYQAGESQELIPDPYLATGVIPPLTSAFRDLSPLREWLPVLDPSVCTGCGSCWSRCPDAAIGAAAVSPAALLEAFMGSTGAEVLRPLASKLAARVSSLCKEPQKIPATTGELLTDAFGWLQQKAALPAERRESMEAGFAKLIDGLGLLPSAVTAPFFQGPEQDEKGRGALLFLGINPDACKGCGICVSTCEAGALRAQVQTRVGLNEARLRWRSWEQLPDTPPAILDRIGRSTEVDPLGAILLSRRVAQSLAGGDGAEPGSGERLALRLALAALEAGYKPLTEGFLKEIHNTHEKIAALIRKLLSDALPADDLDVLARGLETLDTEQAYLTTFLNEAEQSRESGIDAARLRRLVQLSRQLTDLEERITAGRQGFGRSRIGLVLCSASWSGWAGVFPHNPFRDPVSVDLTGDGAELAAGLLEGQLRLAVEGFVTLRKARLELEHPADAARVGAELDSLSWRELTPEERALCPTLLLVGDSGALAGGGLAQVAWLLGTDLPIKMLMLADLDLGVSAPIGNEARLPPSVDPRINVGLLALAQRGACVAQTSIGTPGHLLRCLQAVFSFDGPALIHLHAPSPARHGFAPARTLERARAAVAARVFPLFLYDPRGEGVFGSRLQLDGNPDLRSPWSGMESEEVITPASWALGEQRFAAQFASLPKDAPSPIPLSEYLLLDRGEREGKTPFVSKGHNGAEGARYAVGPPLVAASEERQHAWRTLQELAGLVTPFTARVAEEIRDQVAAGHEAELAALRQEYEGRIRNLEAELRERARQEIRDRLMQLAGYRGGQAIARPPAGANPA